MIVYVEDNVDELDLLKSAVKKRPFEIRHFSNGLEALNYIKISQDIELIITDINMPILNGLELIQQVRRGAVNNLIPIIVLSSSDEKSDIDEAYSQGANGYLIKPIDYQKFKSMIQKTFNFWVDTNTTSSF